MEAETPDDAEDRVLRKLSWMSAVLGEVDDWIDSRTPPQDSGVGARRARPLSFESLDARIARESS